MPRDNNLPALGDSTVSKAAMTKSKKDVKFNHRERRMSKGSMSESNYDSPNESRSPVRRVNGSKNGDHNGPLSRSREDIRPGVGRTDTTASGWQTENEDDKVRDIWNEHGESY